MNLFHFVLFYQFSILIPLGYALLTENKAFEPVQNNCTILRDDFAIATSNFTSCTITFSRPITMCENCVVAYLDVLNTYRNMSLVSDNNTLCIRELANLDRLQIIETTYNNIINLWSRAKCYKCFTTYNETVPELSDDTKRFISLYDGWFECKSKHYSNSSILCNSCMNAYRKLDTFYNGISNENERIGVCMDIVDIMNSTRKEWSSNCCKFRKHDEVIFLLCTVLVSILSVGFYVLTPYTPKKKSPTILPQTRFVESLSKNAGRSQSTEQLCRNYVSNYSINREVESESD